MKEDASGSEESRHDQEPAPQGQSRELGFGTKNRSRVRYINPDGTFNVRRKGLSRFRTYDLYHKLITMSWGRFGLYVLLFYFSLNVVFSMLYLAVGLEHLEGTVGETPLGMFLDAFFFSAQTVTTLGYGRISPVGAPASTIAAIESLVGLMGFALATGLLWGRFSRATAKIRYSKNAIIAPYRGITGFEFRIANERSSQLLEVEAQVILSYLLPNEDRRRFDQLPLEREKLNFLPLSWTVVHPIDEDSPLYGKNEQDLKTYDAEFIILVKAFDETFSQTIYSRCSYRFHELIWGVNFESVIGYTPDYLELDLAGISRVKQPD